MKSLKKILAFVLSMVLVAGISVSGTMAFLSEADADVNVMTTGKVDIKQHEYQRVVENGEYKTTSIDNQTSYVLEAFQQGKPLLPATELDANGNPYNFGAGDYDTTRVKMSQVGSHGSMDVFVNKNAQDKFVTVENTGKSDAYVRTIIAFELGSVANFRDVINTSSFMTAQGVWNVTDIGPVVIDGNNYFVSEYIYNGGKSLGGVHENGVLPAGDTTYPSLAQVYMKATATNEDVEKIDGNKNGTYEILVLSQAVQVDGFADAETALNAGFGKTAEKAAEWFGGTEFAAPVMVKNADELRKALTAGKDVVLTDDITVDQWVMYSETKTIGTGQIITVEMDGLNIEGNGHTLTVNAVESANNGGYLFDDASELNIRNLTITMNCGGGAISLKSGEIENVVFNHEGNAIHPGDGAITIENCVFNTEGQAIYYETARDNLTIINNTFNVADTANAVILRGAEIFTGNVVNSARTVNIVSPNATVANNEFNCRVKLYKNGQSLSGNVFGASAYVDIEDGITVDLSGNYWGGGKPSNTQVPNAIKQNVIVNNYYGTYADGVLSNLMA